MAEPFEYSSGLKARLNTLPADAPVLDLGGWFRPLPRATHVADAMPYETRRGHLNLTPLPGECFTAATWMIADFNAADFRLPVPDKFFAFAYCGQTIEDLENPEPLLREMNRVSRAGVIESPSRLTEQTAGLRDRITAQCGHPHHRWIVDTDQQILELSPKSATATLPRSRYVVPLRTCERLLQSGTPYDCHFAWSENFAWRILPDAEARERAQRFRARISPGLGEVLGDPVVRGLRGLKWGLLRRPRDNPSAWFQEMLRLSAPYQRSTPPRP